MSQVIKIKRSTGSAAPSTIAAGELAFSKGTGTLYIGDPDTSNPNTPLAIGGAIINNGGTPALGSGVTAAEIRNLIDLGTSDNVEFGNATVQNLTVQGTTTTVNSETVEIADNFMLLNSNQSTSSAGFENAGLEVNRGSDTNTKLQWSETADRWQFTNDGSTWYNIPISSEYAPGDITRVSISAGTGIATSGSTDVSSGNFITTLSVDLSELTDMTADVVPSQDELILLDNGADRRKMINEIPVKSFRSSTAGDLDFDTNFIKLNSSGSTNVNGGLYVQRHGTGAAGADAVLFWDESQGKWMFGKEGYGQSIGVGDITQVAISSTDGSITGGGTGTAGDLSFDLEVGTIDGGTY